MSIKSSAHKNQEQPPVERGLLTINSITDRNFFLLVLFSVAGLIAALLVNWFFPQTADVAIREYKVEPLGIFTASRYHANIQHRSFRNYSNLCWNSRLFIFRQ